MVTTATIPVEHRHQSCMISTNWRHEVIAIYFEIKSIATLLCVFNVYKWMCVHVFWIIPEI